MMSVATPTARYRNGIRRWRWLGRLLLLCAILPFPPNPVHPLEVGAAAPPAPTRVEVLVVRPRGIEPSAVQLPAQPVRWLIYNRSGVRGLTLQLNQPDGTRRREIPIAANQKNWTAVLTLAPGSYGLTEATHPSWRCRITVTAP